MNNLCFGALGIDDLADFSLRVVTGLPVQILTLVIVCALLVTLCRLSRKRKGLHHVMAGISVGAVLAAGWLLWASTTYKHALTLLGSEDDEAAEVAYRNLARHIRPARLLALVNDRAENQNVRFYAACLLADRVWAAGDDAQGRSILHLVDNTSSFHPAFFATNSINYSFFPCGHPLFALDVVTRRLEVLRSQPTLAR